MGNLRFVTGPFVTSPTAFYSINHVRYCFLLDTGLTYYASFKHETNILAWLDFVY